jgi:hypothetical protein
VQKHKQMLYVIMLQFVIKINSYSLPLSGVSCHVLSEHYSSTARIVATNSIRMNNACTYLGTSCSTKSLNSAVNSTPGYLYTYMIIVFAFSICIIHTYFMYTQVRAALRYIHMHTCAAVAFCTTRRSRTSALQ